METGTVTLEIIQGADKVKVWTDPAKGAGNLLIDGPGNPFAALKTWVLGTDISSFSELPTSIYIEGINPVLNKDDSVILETKYKSVGSDQATEFDRLLVTVFQTALVPDYNRDGIINNDDRGMVTDAQPWRFWVNDDYDTDAKADGIGDSKVDLPGQEPNDTANTKLTNIRDLVDFFPLYLDLKSSLNMWPPEKGYQYKLFNADGSVAMFIPAANGKYLEAGDVTAYLEDVTRAKELLNLSLTVIDDQGVTLPAVFLDLSRKHDNFGVILLEGIKKSSSPLILEISKNDILEREFYLPLDIAPVEEMYAQLDLKSEAGDFPISEDRFVDRQINKIIDIDKQPFNMQESNRTLAWINGFRVTPSSARATFAEVFKRLYHVGYSGRFLGVQWFGYPVTCSIDLQNLEALPIAINNPPPPPGKTPHIL